jgi:hypothetical protein
MGPPFVTSLAAQPENGCGNLLALAEDRGRSGSLSRVEVSDRHSDLGRSGAFDRDLEVVLLVFDQLHDGLESADLNDAIPIAKVAIVERSR